MTLPQRLPDAGDRRRAATDFTVNLVVSAAAGTGKTSLLVERILNAVGSGRFGLDELAAVTFTRKAAAEMRSRLAAALEQLRALALDDPSPPAAEKGHREAERSFAWLRQEVEAEAATVAARALEALGKLDQFSASTIHSFCGDILRMHPVEAGVDPGFNQDEGAHLEEIFDREWRAFLESELGGEAPRADAWRRALALYSLEELRQAARALADFGAPAPEEWRERCEDPARELAPLARPVAEEARRLLAAAQGANSNFLNFLEAARDLAEAFLSGEWTGGSRGLPCGLAFDVLEKARIPDVGRNASGIDPEGAAAFAKEARKRLQALHGWDEEAARALLKPLRPFIQRVRREYLNEGWISFDGLLALTRNLLRDHATVRRALQQRYRHILVDEFQDTNPLQYEILFYLAESSAGEARRDAWEARLEPGRLFIVGDPKQSIYRFLGADIAAYRRAVTKIASEGGQVLNLGANFRSTAALIGALNRVFEAEFPSSPDDHQPAYQVMGSTAGGGEDSPAVEIWSTGSRPAAAPERRETEARAIAAWVAKHAGEGQEFALREVAILFRATTHMAPYLEALRAAGVELVVEGAREFLDRPEVRHLRALLLCLARPHDPAALLAVLRSPAGNVSDRELVEHRLAGGAWSFLAPVPAASPPSMRRALSWLRALEGEILDRPAEEQVLAALARSGLELAEASHPDGAQALANLRRYALAVAACARDQALPVPRAVRAVEERARPGVASVEESPLADETLEAVRVLTVHKAKGMEFDVVIVPDLCRGDPPPHRSEVEIGWVRERPGALALRTRRGANAWHLLHQHEEQLHDAAEGVRTLYVACTRPRRRLILLAGPADKEDAGRRWPAALRHWGYDPCAPPADRAVLAPGVIHHDVGGWRAGAVPRREAPPGEEAVARFVGASARAAAAAREWERRPSGLVESMWEREETAGGPLPAAGGAPAVVVGRAIHRALERWDGRGDGRAGLRAAARTQAVAAALDPEELERQCAPLWEAILLSDLPGLLREGAARELPVLLEERGEVWRGSLDLLYRTADGRWVVADYKTDDPGADPQASARRHLPQIRVYARAVERALGVRPRAEIFWVRTGARAIFRPEELEGPLG